MRRGEEMTTESSGAPVPVSSQNNLVDKQKRAKIIYIVYLIAALDITWMFLQFSVTPVSIVDMSE